jgi:hypothetical protein
MACELTTGVSLGCRDNSGGVKEFYIANIPSTGLGVTQNGSGMVTAIAAGATFFKYVPRKKTGMWDEAITVNDQNGTVFYAQTALIPLSKMEQAKRNEVMLLAKANMTVIVKDQNDKYWLLGQDNGITLANSRAGSGTDYGDRNGYELNFEGGEPEAAPEVNYSAFSSLISVTTL